MELLTMCEFKNYCKEIVPASFVFDTENQINGLNEDIKMKGMYSDVIIMLNPNRICFKNESGVMCFNRVKMIRHHNSNEMVGEVFSIVCGNSNDTNQDKSYIIIVDK